MPLYALSFSQHLFISPPIRPHYLPQLEERGESERTGPNPNDNILMGVGSCHPNAYNRLQILRLNEEVGISKELEISEPYPSTKIMWVPKSKVIQLGNNNDLLASSSDILRLYELKRSDTPGSRFI